MSRVQAHSPIASAVGFSRGSARLGVPDLDQYADGLSGVPDAKSPYADGLSGVPDAKFPEDQWV